MAALHSTPLLGFIRSSPGAGLGYGPTAAGTSSVLRGTCDLTRADGLALTAVILVFCTRFSESLWKQNRQQAQQSLSARCSHALLPVLQRLQRHVPFASGVALPQAQAMPSGLELASECHLPIKIVLSPGHLRKTKRILRSTGVRTTPV